MDFGFSEEQLMLRDNVRKLMDGIATPDYVRRLDREQAYPYELYDAWVDIGLLGLPFPEELGGHGGDVVDMVLVAEEIARKSFDFFSAFGGSVFCGLNLAHKGSEAQKRDWLPRLLSGEIKMSISMSEPQAGSDVGAMRTTARRDGEDWIVNGQKVWATGAGAKDNVLNVYVKTDMDAPYREGMSLFLIPNDLPGVELRKLDMLGRRCAGTYEIFFDDVRVPADQLVGGENKGWDVLLSGLQIERVTAAAGYVGSAQAAVDLAVNYAKERNQFGRPIGSFQAIAHLLADVQTEVELARTLVWRAAWMSAQGAPDALGIISMAKLAASEAYAHAARVGIQVFGANGYSMEYDMQRHFRDSPSVTIAAGTSQMQRNLIARHMGLRVQ